MGILGKLVGRAEYDFIGLTAKSFTFPATSAVFPNDTFNGSNRYLQMVNLGINYKFSFW